MGCNFYLLSGQNLASLTGPHKSAVKTPLRGCNLRIETLHYDEGKSTEYLISSQVVNFIIATVTGLLTIRCLCSHIAILVASLFGVVARHQILAMFILAMFNTFYDFKSGYAN